MRLFSSSIFIALLSAIGLSTTPAMAQSFQIDGSSGGKLTAMAITDFNSPWAMTFLPSGEMLVTTKPGKLWLVSQDGSKRPVGGLPKIAVGGQGGLGDVVPHPDFASNGLIYLSFVQLGNDNRTRGAVVVRAKLQMSGSAKISNLETIWNQTPRTSRRGHFSHRIAFGPKGSAQEGKLFITSGDRQAQKPAQNWRMALGKIIRLNDDGSVPKDNPFQDKGDLAKTFWSTGHRNLLGISFDLENRLWSHEMGPRHGDELNLIEAGQNYGWPIVSNGNQYSGAEIPNHDTRPAFAAPKAYWVPSIAPSGLVIYSGDKFPDWKGDALIGGLVSRALIRVDLDGTNASEAERFSWGKRIREVEQGPEGNLWVLEDKQGGRLLKLTATR
ncbi:MAG: PQQ-dependent sugar dehydrogenase [Rhizobiaceae bacterium]